MDHTSLGERIASKFFAAVFRSHLSWSGAGSGTDTLGQRRGSFLGLKTGGTKPGDQFIPEIGFCHLFSESEMEELIDSAGYVMTRSFHDSLAQGAYPRATLRRRGTANS